MSFQEMELSDAIDKEMGSLKKPAYIIVGGLFLFMNLLSPPDVILLVFSSPPEKAFQQNPNAYNAQSIITEWDLKGEQKWIPGLLQSLFYVGFMPGTIVCGQLSDKFGRKSIGWKVFLLILIFQIVTGLCQNWQEFAVCRLITGFLVGGRSVVNSIHIQELSGNKLWVFNGAFGAVSFDLNMLGFLLFAYYFPSWRTLYFFTMIPAILGCIFYIISPESPRWLLSQGRHEEAEQIVRRLAKWNSSTSDQEYELLDKAEERPSLPDEKESSNLLEETMESDSTKFVNPENQGEEDSVGSVVNTTKPEEVNSILDIFGIGVLRYRACILSIHWFTVSFVYYCITLGSGSFNPNYYLAFAISALSQLPAIPIFMFFMERPWAGRRRTLTSLLLLASVNLFAIYIMPYTEGNATYRLCLFLLAKIGISGAFSLVYVYTPELFPTGVRNVGLGAMSTCARVGSMTAPFLANYTVDSGSAWPILCFGIVSGLSGMLALYLPETRGRKIINTIHDAIQQEEYEEENEEL